MGKTVQEILLPKKRTMMALMSRNLPKDITPEQLEAIIDQEIFNFEYRFIFQPALYECIPESIENAFRKTIMQGLSFDPDLSLVWMMGRNWNLPSGNIKAIECKPSLNGWLNLYQMAGSLEELLPPEVKLDEKGYTSEVTIGLVVPKYSATGEITGREERKFTFTKADFRIWQKASHEQNSTSKNPGNIITLNLSNPNYWNYKPNVKSSADAPTPDNQGGINPGFAITKCTLHALTRAKLNKNPYAAKKLVHTLSKFIDEVIIEEDMSFNEDKKNYPDFIEDQKEPEVKSEVSEAKPEVKAEVKKEEVISDTHIIVLCNNCELQSEVFKIYNQYKDAVDKNPALKAQIAAIGSKKPQKKEVAKKEEAEEKKEFPSEQVTADNI